MPARQYSGHQRVLKKSREDRYKYKQSLSNRRQRTFYATDHEFFAAKKIIFAIRNESSPSIVEQAVSVVLNFEPSSK